MDISKLDGNAKLDICRKYFFIGLCFLPLVWFTNVIWFFPDAFCRPACPTRSSIRKYVLLSALGFVLWAAILISWETVFQVFRSQGFQWTDNLTFVFPNGRV